MNSVQLKDILGHSSLVMITNVYCHLAPEDGLMEMRNDLATNPLSREFVVLKRGWLYNWGGENFLAYQYDDHPELDGSYKFSRISGS